MNLKINGKKHKISLEPEMPLLWVLRDELGLTGTKYGCGISVCGACTVLVNEKKIKSCVTPISVLENKSITTIEGIAKKNKLHEIQKVWIDNQIPQCGYCQSGMIMSVLDLLKKNNNPTDEEIGTEITNICRCGTYARVKEGIKKLISENKEV